MNQKDEILIEEMNLSARIISCLQRVNIYTVQDLLIKSYDENYLMQIRGIGKNSVIEIIDSVHKMGFKFNFELPQEEKANWGIETKKRMTIPEMRFTVRTHNCLLREDIGTVEELLARVKTENDFMRIRNLTERGIEEIKRKVHALGLQFDFEIEQEAEGKVQETGETQLQNEKEKNRTLSIAQMNFSVRTHNYLLRAGIYSVGDLLDRIQDEDDFRKIRNLDSRSKQEILDGVHRLGLEFDFEKNQQKTEMVDMKDIDAKLQAAIAELRVSYEELRIENDKLKKAKAEVAEKLENIRGELRGSREKIYKIEKLIQENSDLLIELGQLESIEKSLRQQREELAKKQAQEKSLESQDQDLSVQEQEIAKRKAQIQKDLDNMLQEL